MYSSVITSEYEWEVQIFILDS